jgi:hypothetical protein
MDRRGNALRITVLHECTACRVLNAVVAAGKVPVFGILRRGGKVYTKMIADASSKTLLKALKSKFFSSLYRLFRQLRQLRRTGRVWVQAPPREPLQDLRQPPIIRVSFEDVLCAVIRSMVRS